MSNSKRWTGSRNTSEEDREAARLTAESFRHYDSDSSLTLSTPQVVRAGKIGGLPFDTLTTDLFGGCLPGREVCYGNCFAARAAYAAGTDFGARMPNILDRDVLCADLERLPPSQKFLRNGWNSDPSWNWRNALVLSQWIREAGRLTIFNTKSFTSLQPETIRSLAAAKAELWVCVSAFDSDAQIEHRIDTIETFREAGGCAVPLVMTTRFSEPKLNEKQDQLVQYMTRHDLPAAENSLRFAPTSPVMAILDRGSMRQIASTGIFGADACIQASFAFRLLRLCLPATPVYRVAIFPATTSISSTAFFSIRCTLTKKFSQVHRSKSRYRPGFRWFISHSAPLHSMSA